MTERPILFSAPMVRAILGGAKTQTRRVMKPQPRPTDGWDWSWPLPGRNITAGTMNCWRDDQKPTLFPYCPYGRPGDRLWVKETWAQVSTGEGTHSLVYRADSEAQVRWRSSIFMPRWASRISLELTDIRVERLQAISDADCEIEGVRPSVDGTGKDWRDDETGWRRTYRQLWDSLNAKRGHGWDTNPWVWVIEFRRIDP